MAVCTLELREDSSLKYSNTTKTKKNISILSQVQKQTEQEA